MSKPLFFFSALALAVLSAGGAQAQKSLQGQTNLGQNPKDLRLNKDTVGYKDVETLIIQIERP